MKEFDKISGNAELNKLVNQFQKTHRIENRIYMKTGSNKRFLRPHFFPDVILKVSVAR